MLLRRNRGDVRVFLLLLCVFSSFVAYLKEFPPLKHTKNLVTLATSLYKVIPVSGDPCGPSAAQEFALANWVEQFDEVLLMADSQEVCPNVTLTIGDHPNVVCALHSCIQAVYKRPTVPCLIEEAMKLSTSKYILFSNSDLVYYGVTKAITAMQAAQKPFIAVGQRFDINFAMECNNSSSGALQSAENLPGTMHESYGIDYFIFSGSYISIDKMPPFLIGLWKWDNWFLDSHIRDGYNVIDATRAIRAVHLQSTQTEHRGRPSSDYNKKLFMDYYNLTEPNHLLTDPFPIGLGSTVFAPHYLLNGKVIRRWCYFQPFVFSELPCP